MKKDKFNTKMTRRQVLKAGMIGGAGMMLPLKFLPRKAFGQALIDKLSDPAMQPKFVNAVPNALDPGFMFQKNKFGVYRVGVGSTWQQTGLKKPNGQLAWTKLYGYGQNDQYTWPGKTFEVKRSNNPVIVNWRNQLWGQKNHILPVDTSLHWAYSLHGYEKFSIEKNGIPIITHLHGGHTDFEFDGNPEWFYNPGTSVRGPSWKDEGIPFTTRFKYDVDVPAGNLWYHDHALGLTRLNVYAGMAGFFFVRDKLDTGRRNNPLGLPAFPYEMAFAIQDRMFRKNGRLFYPAFPGDPFYDDFIEPGQLGPPEFPDPLPDGGGPTALAEFFGDHMVVNGLIWPKADVEPRNYRMHLLNGTDSRFMALQFRVVRPNATSLEFASAPVPFWVIGSDQGLASEATKVDTLVSEPGGRYDVVFDFSQVPAGSRVILSNEAWDAPFGGDFGRAAAGDGDLFPDSQTDRIMAFDVTLPLSNVADKFDPSNIRQYDGNPNPVSNEREVSLFEGKDEFGRLQPLLGTVHDPIRPNGSVATPYTWANPTTEKPSFNSTERWKIYNFTGDAHPIHLHLVSFEILGRGEITFDTDDGNPGQRVLMHNGKFGVAPVITNLNIGSRVNLGPADGYVENAPKDMVTALPGQVTVIKATFDKLGKYVWHCHILSHEDHEMMRVMRVV